LHATNGHHGAQAAADEGPPTAPAGAVSRGPCPMLGFADDRDRQHSRPTALHRCFASGSASLVSAPEQRELCLGGGYPTCPRYPANRPIELAAARVAPSGPPRGAPLASRTRGSAPSTTPSAPESQRSRSRGRRAPSRRTRFITIGVV